MVKNCALNLSYRHQIKIVLFVINDWVSPSHCNILPAINKSLPIEFLMEKRCAKFIGHVLTVIT